MKTALKRIYQIITLASMMMFVMISTHTLFSDDNQSELDREVENAKSCGKNCRCNGRTAVVTISREVEGDKQKIDVRLDENCPEPEMVAPEHQGILHYEEGYPGEEYRLYLVPVHDNIEEQPERCNRCDNMRHRHSVNIHRSIFLCLVCLFLMLMPVSLKNL